MHAAYATTYLDNIISHNDAWVVHVQQLTTVLESLRQAELTAHIKKCTVKPREVQYLGYDLEGGQLSRPMTNKKKKRGEVVLGANKFDQAPVQGWPYALD